MESPEELTCPRCKGSMRPAFLGGMQDKHYECEYCGLLDDVPDEHSLEHAETVEYTDEHGNRIHRTKRVIRTRRDDGVEEGRIRLGAFREMGLGALVDVELPPGLDVSNLHSETISHRMVFTAEDAPSLFGAVEAAFEGRTIDVLPDLRTAPEPPTAPARKRRWHREVEPYGGAPGSGDASKGWVKVLVAVAAGVALTLIVQAL